MKKNILEDIDYYIPRVYSYKTKIFYSIQNRHQTEIKMVNFYSRHKFEYDFIKSSSTLLFKEENAKYVNIYDGFIPLEEGFYWLSDRSGYTHIYFR